MTMPTDIPIVDTMISFPHADFSAYDFIRKQTKDTESNEDFDFPVEYMFKNVPKELYGSSDPVKATLNEMDKHGVEIGLIGVGDEVGQKALADDMVNLLDIQQFVNLILTGGFQPEADINGDGVVSLLDIGPFVNLLTGE